MFPDEMGYREAGEIAPEEQKSHGRSFCFDFAKGEFVVLAGQVQETDTRQAIEQWLTLLLKTTLDKYRVYRGSEFGTSVEKYIGLRQLPKGYVESELKREISQAVKLNPYIREIEDFRTERLTDGLRVSFGIVLQDGVLGVEMIV